MSTSIETQENIFFCNSFSNSNKKCFSFPTITCSRCSLHFCHLHLWDNICKSCLKQDLFLEFSKSAKAPKDSLISSLSLLESLNDKMSLDISKKRFKQRHLKEKIESLNSFNPDLLRNKVEREIENRKKLESSVLSLKNAVSQLKNHENILSSIEESNILNWFLVEKDVLEDKVQRLIENVDSLNKELRFYVPYSKIRNFSCEKCGNKIKSTFSSQIIGSCKKDDSIISSVMAIKKIKASGSGQEPSCNCLIS